MLNIIDPRVSFEDDPAGLVIRQDQEIPDDFLSQLKQTKIDNHGKRAGEFLHVARIPVLVYERWLREGFDAGQASLKDILARLHRESLDGFIVTDKRV
jgi:hypothetical protein